MKKPKVLLLLILLGAFFLRAWNIDSRDIWYDELLTIQQSEKSIGEINLEVPTPIHYYFVHLFLLFGKSTWVLGIPSVVFGLFTTILVYLIAKRTFSENVGLVAAFLLSISPMHIEFSQQILFFSYFVFFSTLILYIVVDFAFHFEQGRFKWGHLVFLVFINWINVLTQMLALVLIPVQLLFFSYLFARNPKVILLFKKHLILILLFISVLFSVLFSIGGGGYAAFLETLHIGFERPITVGYSLSSQLGSTVINSPIKFLQAMFSWFGIGGGIGLVVYLSFFFLGGIGSFLQRRAVRSAPILFALWFAVPFTVLFSVRIEHWFEEKYFIFMIPAYVILIAFGIVSFTTYIGDQMKNSDVPLKAQRLSFFCTIIVLVGVMLLAVEPIRTRTSFGFLFDGHVNYSWRKVNDYLKENTKSGDRIFLIKGNAAFLNYYHEADETEDSILDENDIIALSPEEYKDLVRTQKENIFVAIPDYNYLFLSDITDWQKIRMVGNFGIYKVSFKKESPVQLKADKSGWWEYYEDFRTSRYISQADYWKNLITSYSDSVKVPDTEGYNVMTPIEFSESFIDYKFILPESTRDVYVQSLFTLNKGSNLQILIGENKENLHVVYEQSAGEFSYFNPQIKIPNTVKKSKELFLRIRFDFDKSADHKIGDSQLKSFSVSNRILNQANFPEEYLIEKSGTPLRQRYIYNANLEIEKSSKWTHAAILKDGWIQTNDGFLIRNHGTKKENPLVFKFVLDKKKYSAEVEIKAFAHHNDPLEFYYSLDGESWELLKVADENVFKIYDFKVQGIQDGKLFLKFVAEKNGPFSQIRNIKTTFVEE